jgi:hypothetical protein
VTGAHSKRSRHIATEQKGNDMDEYNERRIHKLEKELVILTKRLEELEKYPGSRQFAAPDPYEGQSVSMAAHVAKIEEMEATISDLRNQLSSKTEAFDIEYQRGCRIQEERDSIRPENDRLRKALKESERMRQEAALAYGADMSPELLGNAQLGALLMELPKHYVLYRAVQTESWIIEGPDALIRRDTPNDCLFALRSKLQAK